MINIRLYSTMGYNIAEASAHVVHGPYGMLDEPITVFLGRSSTDCTGSLSGDDLAQHISWIFNPDEDKFVCETFGGWHTLL